MPAATYDPASVIVTWGSLTISGFAPETFCNVERAEDAVTTTVGADGFGCHTINRNRSGTVTVTLMQSSLTNSALSRLANLDEQTGDVSYPLVVKDIRSDATLCVAHASKIKKMPASAFGKELGTREWMFTSVKIDISVGGNLPVGS